MTCVFSHVIQILWLFGEDHIITEVGAMNMFFVMKKRNSNELELVTAPLTRGDVLPGISKTFMIRIIFGKHFIAICRCYKRQRPNVGQGIWEIYCFRAMGSDR